MITITRQTLAEQEFIMSQVGGTIVPTSTMRGQDVMVGILSAMRGLERAASKAARRNLAGDIRDAFADLAETYPEYIVADGTPTDTVQREANALVGDPAVVGTDAFADAVGAVWGRFDEVLARGDCWCDGSDGGAYVGPIEASDYDD